MSSPEPSRLTTAPFLPAALETGLLMAGLLVMTGAILPLLSGAADVTFRPEGYPAVQAALLVFYAVVLTLLTSRWQAAVKLAARDPLLWVLTAWVFLSVVWSDAPGLTGRRAVALLLTTLVGLYIALRFDSAGQARLIGWTLTLAAGLSVITVLVWPDLGVDQEFWRGPAWRGVYTQKNHLARTTALLTTASLALVLGSRTRSRLWIGIAALSAAFPLLARSLTALVISVAVYLLLVGLVGWRAFGGAGVDRWQLRHVAVVAALTVVVWTGVSYLQSPAATSSQASPPATAQADAQPSATAPVLKPNRDAMLDRQGTMLSRLQLWRLAGDKLIERPWLGYGYGAFWRGTQGPSAYIWKRVDWRPPSAHNGFVDVALEIGVIGLLLMCAHLARTGAGAVAAFRQRGVQPLGLWPILFFAFFCLYSIPETSLLMQNSLLWAVYVAVALSVKRRRA